jgi:hypothetical protein
MLSEGSDNATDFKICGFFYIFFQIAGDAFALTVVLY